LPSTYRNSGCCHFAECITFSDWLSVVVSPVKNVTETDIKAKSDCARPDCLREAMKSKSKKHSPSTSTVPRGRGRPRKVKIEDKEASSPVDDKYIVERFIGRWKRYVGGEGLVFEYLVKWHK